MSYDDLLDLQFIKGSRSEKFDWWRLAESRMLWHNSRSLFLPTGYTTNGPSVPRWLWWLIPPHGRSFLASAIHDACYEYQYFSRKESDRLFLELLKQSNLPFWQPYLMYWYVRLLGWYTWNQYVER